MGPHEVSGQVYRHAGCGLVLESDIELPGLVPVEEQSDRQAIAVRQADLPESLGDGIKKQGPNWERSADAFLLRIPGLARFRIRDADAIEYQPEGDTPREDLTAFLTGSVLGILLHLRGSVVLHASAVIVDGQAMLFCGRSGAGKSTLAAALGERGYPMMSDDLCPLSPDDAGRLWVEADGREHKLWHRSLAGLNLMDRRGEEVRHQIDKFFVAPQSRRCAAAPVGGLYELVEQRAGEEPGIEPLSIPDASLLVRRNAFRPRIMWQLDQKAEYFRTAAALAAHGNVARFRRPLDFDRVEEGIALLEESWRANGLTLPEGR